MKHVDSNVRERALRLNFETAVFQRFALMPTTCLLFAALLSRSRR